MSEAIEFTQDFFTHKFKGMAGIGDQKGPEAVALADQFFVDLLDTSIVVLECEAASVFFLREGKDELEVGISTGVRKEDLSRICIKLGIGVVGHAAKFDEVLMVNEPGKDMRFNRGFDRKTGFSTRNLLAVPIHDGGRVAGVLEFVNKNGRPFNDADLARVTQLFTFIAVPLHEALTRTSYLH